MTLKEQHAFLTEKCGFYDFWREMCILLLYWEIYFCGFSGKCVFIVLAKMCFSFSGNFFYDFG